MFEVLMIQMHILIFSINFQKVNLFYNNNNVVCIGFLNSNYLLLLLVVILRNQLFFSGNF